MSILNSSAMSGRQLTTESDTSMIKGIKADPH